MVHATPCPHCGRSIPRQPGPNPRCPACRAALPDSPLNTVGSDSAIAPGVTVRRTTAVASPGVAPVPQGLSQSNPGLSQSRPGLPSATAPAPRRQPTESSLAAARMANAPTFKTTRSGGGLSLLPIVAGVILTLAITAYALTRGKPTTPLPGATGAADPKVTTIGRPPAPESPPVTEPEPPAPVVTRDLPPDEAPAPAPPPAPRAARKAGEREAVARPARPAPQREVARADKPAAATRAGASAPASAPVPAATPAPPAARPEPEPPAPPPQFAAATPASPPTASAPMSIGPSASRDGYQKARQVRPGCVTSSLRLPRDVSGLDGESALVKFQVDETGAVSQFTYLSGPTDQRVANAIWAAVQRCEWAPGVSAQGTPLTLWVTMPVKFGR